MENLKSHFTKTIQVTKGLTNNHYLNALSDIPSLIIEPLLNSFHLKGNGTSQK